MPPSLLIPSVDVRALRCGSPSGFRNVYRHGKNPDGEWVYVAKVKRDGRLTTLPGSRSTQAQVTAAAVVRWYEQQYGPRWRDVLAMRKSRRRPADPPWRVYESRADRGYTLGVFLDGVEEVAVKWDAARGRWTDRPLVFPTREAAVAFAVRYACLLYTSPSPRDS